MLIVALEVCGLKAVFKKVGMEPSGEAFDSLVELDVSNSKPYNPLINSGALAVCGLLLPEVSFQDMIRYTRNICADSEIELNESVFDSEMKTCSRNRSIAYHRSMHRGSASIHLAQRRDHAWTASRLILSAASSL